jgi:hypothetical protein
MVNEFLARRGGANIVPQQRGSNDIPRGVEDNHSVLLRGNRDGANIIDAPRVVDGLE